MNNKQNIFPDIHIQVAQQDCDKVLSMKTALSLSYDGVSLSGLFFTEDRKSFSQELNLNISNASSPFKMANYRIEDDSGNLKSFSITGLIHDNVIDLYMIDVTAYYEEISQHKIMLNRYEQLMRTLKEGVWDWDPSDNKVYYSDHWYELLGYNREEIEPNLESWKQRVHPDDLEKTMKALEEHIQGKTDIYEAFYRMKKKNGDWIWIRDRGIRQLDSCGVVVRLIGSHRDITEEKTVRENLEKMIITDELTSLYNRRHYDKRLDDELLRAERYGSKLSILMIDIDLFKEINDTYGHSAGDAALKELAQTIKNKIRNTDSAYRVGGEEFVVIAPLTDEDSAVRAAERLREAVSSLQINTGYGTFSFTISLGVATFVQGDTHASLNERVDVALYKSKESGRNRVTLSLL